jgi:hypothetical protein
MNHLTLNDIRMFLAYLLGPRRAELDAIEAARVYAAVTLVPRLAAIEALPPESFGGTPNVEELAETDRRHDSFGLALFFLALFYITWPKASTAAKAAANLIFAKYVPNKAHLRAGFATQASRAQQREPQLVTDKATLDLLPVEGGTAHGVATDYVQAGIELGMLLSGRAEQKGARADALLLRGQAIADVTTLRSMIGRVHSESRDGGAAVDRKFFNYLDTLCDLRDSGSKAPTPPPPVDADPVAT